MDENQAIDAAFAEADQGDLLVLLIDDIDSVIARLKGRRFGAVAEGL